jgi:hypothetical protein
MLWNDLASADAERAYRAVWLLAKAPEQAVPLLEARVWEPLPDGCKASAERRAVEVLELAATSSARRLLAIWTQCKAGTPVGEEARAARKRLDQRLGTP